MGCAVVAAVEVAATLRAADSSVAAHAVVVVAVRVAESSVAARAVVVVVVRVGASVVVVAIATASDPTDTGCGLGSGSFRILEGTSGRGQRDATRCSTCRFALATDQRQPMLVVVLGELWFDEHESRQMNAPIRYPLEDRRKLTQ